MASTGTRPARRRNRNIRVVALAAGLPAEPIPVGRQEPVPDHIRAGLDAHLRSMIAHDPGTRRGDDPEELHQMRVAVRRMRALLKAGRSFVDTEWSEPLRAELGWLGGVLGAVRDLDVLLLRLRAETADLSDDERSAAARLISGLEVDHGRSREELVTALDDDRYTTLVTELVQGMRAPALTLPSTVDGKVALLDIVRKQFRKLRKAAAQAGPDTSDDQLHALRIQGKRLRYAAELAAFTGKPMRRLVAACKRFQDVLGEHQDARVADTRVRQLLDDLDDEVDVDTAFVAGRLVEREAARRTASRNQWWTAWLSLKECGDKALG